MHRPAAAGCFAFLLCLLCAAPPARCGTVEDLEAKLASASGEERVFLLNRLSGLLSGSDLARCIEYARQARDLARDLKNRKGEMLAWNNLGVGYAAGGWSDKALECMLKSLDMAEQIGFEDIGGMYNNLGGLYLELEDWTQALTYLTRSLDYIRPENEVLQAHTLANIGEVYRKTGDLEQALAYLERAREIYKSLNRGSDFAGVLYSIGSVHCEAGETDAAMDTFKLARFICDRIGDREGMVYALSGIGDAYQARGEPDAALKAYREALALAGKLDSQALLAQIHKSLSAVLSAEGDFKGAFEHQKAWYALEKRLQGAKSRERIDRLRAIHDMERKNREIELLRSRQEEDAFEKKALLAGALAALLAAAAFLLLYRRARGQKALLADRHREIAAKNEELALLNDDLRDAMQQVRRLRGLIPVCSYCNRVRDDKGRWQSIEAYVRDRSEADFSHGICPDCFREHGRDPDRDAAGDEPPGDHLA